MCPGVIFRAFFASQVFRVRCLANKVYANVSNSENPWNLRAKCFRSGVLNVYLPRASSCGLLWNHPTHLNHKHHSPLLNYFRYWGGISPRLQYNWDPHVLEILILEPTRETILHTNTSLIGVGDGKPCLSVLIISEALCWPSPEGPDGFFPLVNINVCKMAFSSLS
jgi:hypothetical protein